MTFSKSYNRIIISSSHRDNDKAFLIAERLNKLGFEILLSSPNGITAGSNWLEEILYRFHTSDFVLILLSESFLSSINSNDEFNELIYQSKQRKITIIPVLIEKCNIPSDLLDFNVFNLSNDFDKGFDKLLQKIKIIPEISFEDFNHEKFDELIYDLIIAYGFKNIERETYRHNVNVDFIAQYYSKNPFGQICKENWVIETKFYSESRFDIKSIKSIISAYGDYYGGRAKLLLITNSQINSVIENYLYEVRNNSTLYIEVIDGLLLKKLISNKKKILNKYFL